MTVAEGEEVEEYFSDARSEIEVVQFEIEKTQTWYLDFGAIRHVTGDKDTIDEIKEVESGTITTTRREKHKILGIGDAKLCIHSGAIKLKEVLYVPTLRHNLISVGSLTEL